MAVGRVFTKPVAAGLVAGDIGFAALRSVTDGAFDIELNGSLASVGGLDFSGASSMTDIASILSGALPSGLTASLRFGSVAIQTAAAGENATLDYAAAPGSGTDVSALLGLTRETGAQVWNGYTPAGLVAEAELVKTASHCNGRPVYGWTLDRAFRDTQEQKDFADWIESSAPAVFLAATNSVAAYNAADTTNIGYYASNKGYIRTATVYHNNAQVYPDISYLAFLLATNYSLPDSAVTMKFKQLDGIEPTMVTETQLAALNARRINVYTAVGNNSRTVREGVQGAETWFSDSIVNLDNFKEELQVEVYNVFLRNRKVPYTTKGQNLLVSAARKICAKYARNGVFADRDIEDPTTESGFTTVPATNITPVSVAFSTASERAERLAPPINITAYEASAMHRVSINVDVYN
ncbi:MAG: DUF3383 domain-containing protein [Deltaproteobacteria bacterium]|nr:DUF3383 domain-containing protein [Deltaproteobacteria bacterium]